METGKFGFEIYGELDRASYDTRGEAELAAQQDLNARAWHRSQRDGCEVTLHAEVTVGIFEETVWGIHELVSADCVVEFAQERAAEEVDEGHDQIDPTNEAKTELSALLADWGKKHGLELRGFFLKDGVTARISATSAAGVK